MMSFGVMKNQKERQRIALAALLHDIGKFWQRADDHYRQSNVLAEVYPKETWDLTVPLYENGDPKYVHALWTNAFFVKTKTGKKLNLESDGDDTLANLSANHHKPHNHNEAIISLADKWSSGIDRPDEGEEGVSGYHQVKNKYGKDFVRRVPMHSIFDSIVTPHGGSKTGEAHTYRIRSLELDAETIFPGERDNVSLQDDYKKLWDAFEKEYRQILESKTDFHAFYVSLLTLLKKYTWCIPSATNVLPSNVSLYEHLKSTAAIALSLFDYFHEQEEQLQVSGRQIVNQPKQDPLLLVCVDVSGIQKFIYDIANKKAAASLKGRSFYIEILLRNVIDELIRHENIDALPSNVIYSSGGKAYLILANTQRVRNALASIQDKIAKNLHQETNGQLFVAIGYTSFRYESRWGEIEYDGGVKTKGYLNRISTDDDKVIKRYITKNDTFNLSMLWRSVSDKAAENKNKKFRNVYIEDFDKMFVQGIDFDANARRCAVTGEKILGNAYKLDDVSTVAGGKLYISEVVNQQIEIGKMLRTARQIVFSDNADFHTANLGRRFHFKESFDDFASLVYLNDWPNFGRNKGGQSNIFYGGNYQPSLVVSNGGAYGQKERLKTFEELCKTDDGKDTKLAVLRMDVDNLGQIFISGIKKKSFAAYATLSMMLDIFFAGYINTIQLSNTRYKEHIQIIYSGGDDVFAVGRWDVIIEFASALRDAFKKFVARDDISISAGVSIVHPKFPISKAALDAGESEAIAKTFVHDDGKTKDAIVLFRQPIGWGKEWAEVQSLKNSFEYFLSVTGRALLHNIQLFKVQKDKSAPDNAKGKAEDLSYVWQSGYKLTRLMERIGEKEKDAFEFVKMLRDRILHDPKFGVRFLDLAAVAARWAEYTLRDMETSSSQE